MRDDRSSLEQLIEYADEISSARERFGDDIEDYLSDPFYRSGCTQFILQIGECVNRLSDEFKNTHPEIPWSGIIGIRNLIAHRYNKLSDTRIWEIITVEIPELREYCVKALLSMRTVSDD